MKKLLLSTTFLAGILSFSNTAFAQTAPVAESAPQTSDKAADGKSVPAQTAPVAQSAAQASGEATGGIQDIVVTAQRKEENLQRAPIAITAIGGEEIRSAGVVAPQNLGVLVPALQVVSAGAYPLFYIRGVGNFNANPLSDSAIAISFNDVYLGRPTSTYGLFYDLERVEVLKGPQGTLYGRNATGGSINILPRKPRLGETSGEASFEYGNFNAIRIDAAANIPVSDIAAFRVAGIVASHDGYTNVGNSDQNDAGGRLSFLLEPSSDLTVNLEGDYYSQKGKGGGTVVVPNGVKDRIDVTSPEGQAFYVTQPVGPAGRNFNGLPNTSRQDNQYWGASANITWSPDWGSITFIPAYRGADIDFESNPGFNLQQREKDKQLSAELRISSKDDQALQWLIGGFYFDEDINVPYFSPNLQYSKSIFIYKTGTKSSAVFGRLTYEIAPNLSANIGGRYTHEQKYLTGTDFAQSRLCVNFPIFNALHQVVISGPCPGATAFASDVHTPVAAQIPFDPAFPFLGLNEIYGPTAIFQTAGVINRDDHATFNRFTWRAGLNWQVTPQNLIYVNYETGFKAGGFYFSADQTTYKPESINAFTIGSKNRFFDNRLQVNVEGFYWRYKDQQITDLGQDSQRNVILPTRNVGNATSKGLELETQFAVTKTTLLTADIQYLDAVYKSFVYQIPNQGPPVTGCKTSGLNTPSITLDCTGKRPPNAPKWNINLGAEQTIDLAGGANFVLNGRAHYQSTTLTGLQFVPDQYQKGYWQADASLTFNAQNDKLFITAFINNAFDTRVKAGTLVVALGRFISAQLNTPRTYGLRAGFKF